MIPKEVITALNKSVATTNSPLRTPKRGNYTKYIDSDPDTIGRYAGENGTPKWSCLSFFPVNRTETSTCCTSMMVPRLIGISKVYINYEIKVNE